MSREHSFGGSSYQQYYAYDNLDQLTYWGYTDKPNPTTAEMKTCYDGNGFGQKLYISGVNDY